MIWIIITTIYLLIGFYFSKPDEWNIFIKIIAHIFWLPVVVGLYLILLFAYKKDKKLK